jgi:hypothetical protein
MRVRLRNRSLIHSAWLVRVLASSSKVHRCESCGGRMFVRSPSGLCPLCYTRRELRAQHIDAIVQSEADGDGAYI